MAKPPTKEQQTHAQRITHRDVTGKFKPAPHQQPKLYERKKPIQPELDQDSGSGFRPDHSNIQD